MIKKSKFFHQNVGVSKNLHFSWECSTGDVKCSFDNPSDFFYTECQKLFAQACRSTKQNFLRNFFPSNCLLGHVKRKFDKHAVKVSTKVWKVCFNLPNWWKNTIFPGKKSFPSKCSFRHIECSFENCVEKNSKKRARIFLSMS